MSAEDYIQQLGTVGFPAAPEVVLRLSQLLRTEWVRAEQLAEVVGEKRWAPPGLLPQGLRPTPGVIEVWVANPESKSAPP